MEPTNGLLLEHIARYYFSTPYVHGRILDMACGVGYGAHMIARTCKRDISEVIGIDNDVQTVEYAQKFYYNPRVHFRVENVLQPDLANILGQFDTILSFETIEHIADDKTFMNNIEQLIKPGGRLILSTPFGKGRGKPTTEPFHVHQYTEKEFKDFFRDFSQVEYYYQRGVTIEPKRANVHYPIGVAVCIK